jgi:uncharacterized membrane protein HdeD (DUF308 family)
MTAVAGQAKKSSVPWWLILLEGISLVILGILFLVSPGMTSVVVVELVGIYFLVAGILRLVSMFVDSSMWGWKLLLGILGIIAGLAVLQHPIWAPMVIGATIVIVLGIEGLIMGIVSLIQAFKGGGWGLGLLGIVNIILGIVLLANLYVVTLSLPWVLGILAIVGGIIAIIGAFRQR